MKRLLFVVFVSLCLSSFAQPAAGPYPLPSSATTVITNSAEIGFANFTGVYADGITASGAPVLLVTTNLYRTTVNLPASGTWIDGPRGATASLPLYILNPDGLLVFSSLTLGVTNLYMSVIAHRASEDVYIGQYGQDHYIFVKDHNSLHLTSGAQPNQSEWLWATNNGVYTVIADGYGFVDGASGNPLFVASADGNTLAVGGGIVAGQNGNLTADGTLRAKGIGGVGLTVSNGVFISNGSITNSAGGYYNNLFIPAGTLGVSGRSDFTNFVVLKTNLPSAIPSLTGGTVAFWPSNNGSLYVISANNSGTLTTNLIVAPH